SQITIYYTHPENTQIYTISLHDALPILKDAKEILEDEAATQEEVDAALETLKNAASGLAKVEIPVPVNKNAIKVVVGIYKTSDETEYTKESWTILAEALEAADQVIADEETTQEEVDAALQTLIDAGEGLQKAEKPVEIKKVGLEVATTIYATYDAAEYTEESWEVFAQALEIGRASCRESETSTVDGV